MSSFVSFVLSVLFGFCTCLMKHSQFNKQALRCVLDIYRYNRQEGGFEAKIGRTEKQQISNKLNLAGRGGRGETTFGELFS